MDVGDESIYMETMPLSNVLLGMLSASMASDDESLALGDGVDDDEDDRFLSLFFIVEFQKFFISLSVRPGKRAAI